MQQDGAGSLMQNYPDIPSAALRAHFAAENAAKNRLYALFGDALDRRTSLPCCDFIGAHRLSWVIAHLNDIHHWSREKIADWLDSLDVDIRVRRSV